MTKHLYTLCLFGDIIMTTVLHFMIPFSIVVEQIILPWNKTRWLHSIRICDAWTIKTLKYIILKNPDCLTICLEMPTIYPYSILYKLNGIVIDIAHHRLFKVVTINGNKKENRSFLPLLCVGVHAINTCITLHHKYVRATCKGPSYFKD